MPKKAGKSWREYKNRGSPISYALFCSICSTVITEESDSLYIFLMQASISCYEQ